MNFIGNERIKTYFDRISTDAIPQTMVFVGPRSVGKNTFASGLAARLLNCSPEAAVTHPNIIRLLAGADPKTGNPRAAIPVAEVRAARQLFHLRRDEPLIIIIERAQELQAESGNALLKIMEEPGRQLYFMLCALSEDEVLQTIRSRSSVVRLSAVPTVELVEALLRETTDRASIDAALEIALGRPGIALRFLRDTAFRERVATERMRFSELRRARTMAAAEKIIAPFFEKKDRHIEARAELAEVLEWWLIWLQRDAPTHDALAQIARTIPLLFENMHPRLLMERIVIELVA